MLEVLRALVRAGVVRRGVVRGRPRGRPAPRPGRGRVARSASRRGRGRRAARSTPSTGTACCARTARDRTAYAAGTRSSSAGWPRSRRRPLRAEWYVGRPLLVTTNDYALDVYNGEIGVVVRQGLRPRAFISGARERLQRLRARPPRRGRDDARDDHPQEPRAARPTGSPCCCPRRARGCSPASCSTPPSPGPRSTCASSAPRPPSAPPSPAAPPAPPGLAERLRDV